uniref:WGS project CAEQ00000000 data, annotated contig 1891 n=1 Tax=Trypanosoma congolense (strain IL3000) TaxID=1068625 RepID=F9W9T0_TRYCI|nr:unnamed protein product [Trypanosoma congolense IL3000]
MVFSRAFSHRSSKHVLPLPSNTFKPFPDLTLICWCSTHLMLLGSNPFPPRISSEYSSGILPLPLEWTKVDVRSGGFRIRRRLQRPTWRPVLTPFLRYLPAIAIIMTDLLIYLVVPWCLLHCHLVRLCLAATSGQLFWVFRRALLSSFYGFTRGFPSPHKGICCHGSRKFCYRAARARFGLLAVHGIGCVLPCCFPHGFVLRLLLVVLFFCHCFLFRSALISPVHAFASIPLQVRNRGEAPGSTHFSSLEPVLVAFTYIRKRTPFNVLSPCGCHILAFHWSPLSLRFSGAVLPAPRPRDFHARPFHPRP